MKIIARPRSGGKTTKIAALLLADPDAICLFTDFDRSQRMAHLLARAGAPNPRAQVWVAAPGCLRAFPNERKVYVEELDAVVAMLLGRAVDAATFTGELDFRYAPADCSGPLLIP